MVKSIDLLLIEDNPGDVELTRESLNTGKIQNNLQVIMDGEEAMDYLFQRGRHRKAQLPDIILLDLNLPRISGREILKSLKKDKHRRRIPVIILSSSEAASDVQESYQLHANCFLTKPVKLENFMDMIRTVESFWVDIVRLPN